MFLFDVLFLIMAYWLFIKRTHVFVAENGGFSFFNFIVVMKDPMVRHYVCFPKAVSSSTSLTLSHLVKKKSIDVRGERAGALKC